MNLQEIKSAVMNGQTVMYGGRSKVICDKHNQWLIVDQINGYTIGLTWEDGTTMNGSAKEFYICPTTTTEERQQIELISHMEDFGYKEHFTGGDCRSFMKQIDKEYYLLITNEDGLDIPSEATEPATIGMYSLLRDGTLAEFTKISIFDFLDEEDEYIAKLLESAKRMIAVQNEDKRQADLLLEDVAKMAYYAGEQQIYVSNGIIATYEVCISIAKEFHAKHTGTNWDEEEIDWDAQAEQFFDEAIEKVQHTKRRTEQPNQKQPEPQVVTTSIFLNDQLRHDYFNGQIISNDDAFQKCSLNIEEVSDGRQGTMFELAIIKDEEITHCYTYFDREQAESDGYTFVAMHPEYDDAEL